MCLYNNVSKVRKLLKSTKKHIKGYKIYQVDYNNNLYPFYYNENKVIVNKNRYIQSNTSRKKPSLRQEEINQGLHIYTTRPSIMSLETFRLAKRIVVVKVVGYRKDLLGIGYDDDAVFTKVRVSKRELIRLQTLGIKI